MNSIYTQDETARHGHYNDEHEGKEQLERIACACVCSIYNIICTMSQSLHSHYNMPNSIHSQSL